MTTTRPAYAAGPICLDELVTVMGQYPVDHRWNGWLTPHLDPSGVMEVIEAFESDPYGSDHHVPTIEWRDDGAYVTLVLTEYDGDEPAGVDEITPDEDGLYALGAFAWCWSPDVDDYPEDEPVAVGRDGRIWRWTDYQFDDAPLGAFVPSDEDCAWFVDDDTPKTLENLTAAVAAFYEKYPS